MTIVETWIAGTECGKIEFKIKRDEKQPGRMIVREVPEPLSPYLGRNITVLLGHLAHKFGRVHAKRVLIEEAAA